MQLSAILYIIIFDLQSLEGKYFMELLKQLILERGVVKSGGVLRVDSFLNHQIDINLYREIGKEFYRLFSADNVTKIVTIEASGIGIACITAQFFNVPVVFAKKNKTSNVTDNNYVGHVYSFTHQCNNDIIINKSYLNESDRILIIDDFLAVGNAIEGLIDIVTQAKATLVGAGTVIEKGFQGGGDKLRRAGIKVESLAIVDAMDEDGTISFRD